MRLTKETFREKSLQRLRNLPRHNKLYRDALCTKEIEKILKHSKKGVKVLFYYPMGFEVDVTKLLKKMRKKGEVFLPFMEGKSFKMVPFRLPLKRKKFGIFEAGNTLRNLKKIDIAIVPVIGVDKNLKRVGYGKGMYDRFFAQLPSTPYTIFVEPLLCYTKEEVCDSYDIKADVVITADTILHKRSVAYNKRK